jgi:hypothetical protein
MSATRGCMFCQGLDEALSGHTRNECPLFTQLKQKTSSQPYIDVQLKPQDSEGYAAAGVLPWRRTSNGQLEMLLAREYRPECRGDPAGDKLNFLGGKRRKREVDALTCAVDRATQETGGQLSHVTTKHMREGDKLNFLGGKRRKREVDALTCAVNRATQETGGQLSLVTTKHMREGCPLVCWNSNSKYALFIFELVGENDRDVDVRCAGMPNAMRLEWATRQELLESAWTSQQMHPFAIKMLEQLTSCRIMKHLEEVFDVAYAPTLEPSPREGRSAADHVAASDNMKDLNIQQVKLANAASSDIKKNVKQVQDLLSRLSKSP